MLSDIKDGVVSNLEARIHQMICLSGGFFVFNPSTTVCLLLLVDVGHPEVDGMSILSFLDITVCFLHNEYIFWSF